MSVDDFEWIKKLLDDCTEASTARNHPFTAWELEFIEDVTFRFQVTGRLSEYQLTKLTEIWEKI